jgi:N utilization substance protein B
VSPTTETRRRRAREAAFRVAYQADVAQDSYLESWRSRRDLERLSDDQSQLVADVVQVLDQRGAEVDGHITAAAEHWPLDRIAATDRSVLRVGVAELIGRAGTPARVVLNEAIEIAREFGSESSASFVNGVLDRVARLLRPEEF